MEDDADIPTPIEEWTLEELVFMEEQLQEMFLTSTGESQVSTLRAIGATHVAEWYLDRLSRIQEILDERGIPAHMTDRGVQIRRTSFTVIEGEAS